MMRIPKTDSDIISDIIKREGGLSHDAADRGGLTFEGISHTSNPDLFKNGLPTDAQVRQRYEDRYIKGIGLDNVTDMKLRSLLVDYAVNSGPAIAIMALQRIVGVTPDGILGPATRAAMGKMHVEDMVNGVVAERIKMICRIVTRNPSQLRFLSGWLNRTLEWLQ